MQERQNGIVLVVDDEEYVRDIVTRWLTAEGHRCVTAASADAAWEYLQKHEVHVVTLDVTMPGRSGVELLREITKADRDLQVIMLTALSQTETAIEALTNGACAYLIKPFMRVELAFHVRLPSNGDLLVAKRRQMFDLEEQVRQQTLVIRRTQEETIHRLISASEGRDAETGACPTRRAAQRAVGRRGRMVRQRCRGSPHGGACTTWAKSVSRMPSSASPAV